MTLAKEKSITKSTLRELSIEASRLWEEIEYAQNEDEDKEENQVGLTVQRLIENQGAIETKIDSIVWVKEQLEAELAGWEEKKKRVLALYDDAIESRKNSIEQIKQMLLFLHKTGLIHDKNKGKECEIEIRNNPPSVAQLNLDIESEDFPNEFKRVKISPNNKAIIEAFKAGIDVSKYADIQIGKQVRFKRRKSKS